MYLYFYLISSSFLGYGILTNKLLNIKTSCFGILGLLGITFLTLISYSSTLFFAHNYFFNSFIIILGIILFVIFFNDLKNTKKEFFLFFIFFSILLIFISVAKNHDDFPYYHFPYISILNEFSHPVGLGQLNNGFRSPSSIFFLSSLFYLPKIDHYLFHTSSAFIMGFSNILLLKIIFDKKTFNDLKFLNFLGLFTFCLINIFFYRLSEHGTDRSGMIIVLISIIYLLKMINLYREESSFDYSNLFKLFAIFICFVVSIKPFYLIYLSFFILVFIHKNIRKIFLDLLFTKTFYYCFIFLFFTVFFTFINSACLIFPIEKTCFENLYWSIGNSNISDTKIWFELWSKAGATPTKVVEDRVLYISNFNWLTNWIEIYFFNKILDYLLGLMVLSVIVFSLFYKRNLIIETSKIEYKLVYLIIFLFFIEWFLNHPTLRYGGYHIIALIFFIPVCVYLQRLQIDYKVFAKKTLILVIISIVAFFGRNVSRLNKEIKLYNYNPVNDLNYKYIGGDKNFYFRYTNHINKHLNQFRKINIIGKEFLIITLKEN